jgi:hypothetical protein
MARTLAVSGGFWRKVSRRFGRRFSMMDNAKAIPINRGEAMNMKAISRPYALIALLVLTVSAPSAVPQQSQYPILDKFAQKVIEKYRTTSCADLKAKKEAPKPAQSADQEKMKQKVVMLLRNDPKMREHFLNMIAGPIANKMFECGMVP